MTQHDSNAMSYDAMMELKQHLDAAEQRADPAAAAPRLSPSQPGEIMTDGLTDLPPEQTPATDGAADRNWATVLKEIADAGTSEAPGSHQQPPTEPAPAAGAPATDAAMNNNHLQIPPPPAPRADAPPRKPPVEYPGPPDWPAAQPPIDWHSQTVAPQQPPAPVDGPYPPAATYPPTPAAPPEPVPVAPAAPVPDPFQFSAPPTGPYPGAPLSPPAPAPAPVPDPYPAASGGIVPPVLGPYPSAPPVPAAPAPPVAAVPAADPYQFPAPPAPPAAGQRVDPYQGTQPTPPAPAAAPDPYPPPAAPPPRPHSSVPFVPPRLPPALSPTTGRRPLPPLPDALPDPGTHAADEPAAFALQKRREQGPRHGLRGALYRMRLPVRKSLAEQEYDRDIEAINKPIRYAKTIGFANFKGGVGKTTLAMGVASTVAEHRRSKGEVVIIDTDHKGSLARRTPGTQTQDLQQLAADPNIATIADVTSYMLSNGHGLSILGSSASALAEALQPDQYLRALQILHAKHLLVFVDMDTSAASPAYRTIVESLDVLVVPVATALDSAHASRDVMEWLRAHELQELADRVVILLNFNTPANPHLDTDGIALHYRNSENRPVVEIPWDDHLAEAGPVSLDLLNKGTRRMFVKAAAEVINMLPTP